MYIDISHDTEIQNLLVICIFLNSKEKQNFQFSRDHHIHAPINYMIKFVSDFQQVSGFQQVLRFPPPIKLIATI
jgi:hypothetical protein